MQPQPRQTTPQMIREKDAAAMTQQEALAILDLGPGSDKEQIEKRYELLVRRYRHATDPVAKENLARINAAYATLNPKPTPVAWQNQPGQRLVLGKSWAYWKNWFYYTRWTLLAAGAGLAFVIYLIITMVTNQPADFKIRADAVKVKQILYNLLSNAVKFTPDNGKVEVEAFQQGQFVQIRVRDNGIGIRDEDQERVFVEFEQVDNSYQRLYEGTGLGLPLTRKLVEMHGGQIFLISKEGVGTEVVFTLPIPGIDVAGHENTGKDEKIG